MKKRNTLFLLAAFAISVMISSCAKDKVEEAVPTQEPTPTANTNFSFSDGHGVLAAVKSVSYTTVAGYTVPVETNTAVAVFSANPGTTAYADAGAVQLNGKELTKQSNNSYVYQNFTNPLMLSQVSWTVAGTSAVPSINYTHNKPMPSYSGYDALPTAITRNNGLTVGLGNAVSGADSVYVIVTGNSEGQYLLKRFGGAATQAVFSASELSGLTAGNTGLLQVVPWNYTPVEFSGKKVYFVNETAYSKIGVTIN